VQELPIMYDQGVFSREYLGESVSKFMKLLNHTSRTIDDFRNFFKPDKEMVDLAVELIERKSGDFKPEQFEDHYATALRELVNKKMKGQKIKAPHEEAAPGGAKVIDLMAALRKSIGEGSGKAKPAARAGGRRAPATRSTKKRA